MFVVLVHATVRADLLPEFEAAILENARRSEADEPGCLRFLVSQQRDDPTRWMFYEVYRDEASWEAHRASPHFQRYRQVAERALLERTASQWTLRTGLEGERV